VKAILFADDQKNIREWFKEEFEDDGYRVMLARDGEEAVRLVQQSAFDLVVLDLWMPAGHGLEAVERIKTLAPDVPILFFTGNDELCVRDPRSRFATACVDKTGDLMDLKLAVKRALYDRDRQDTRLGLPPVSRT
jgi:CheY-like chemotaxis protein